MHFIVPTARNGTRDRGSRPRPNALEPLVPIDRLRVVAVLDHPGGRVRPKSSLGHAARVVRYRRVSIRFEMNQIL